MRVKDVQIGGDAPITIQSMTNTDTRDVAATLSQIRALHEAGCELVRVALFDMDCVEALKALVADSPLPVIADVHFDHRIALGAIRAGAHKLRINPGNIGGAQKVKEVARCAQDHGVPLRVGANAGSLHRDLLRKYGGPTPQALVESVLDELNLLQSCGFEDCVVAIKASNVPDTVEANRLLSEQVDYPVHIGITEAGGGRMGLIKGAAGIGALLMQGIGDTLRVSLTGDPIEEPRAGLDILKAVGVRQQGVNVISCPTCGRCRVDLAAIAAAVEQQSRDIRAPLTVAVMGCAVNGPGEARMADVGIACGRGRGVLFIKGEQVKSVEEQELVPALMETLRALAADWTSARDARKPG